MLIKTQTFFIFSHLAVYLTDCGRVWYDMGEVIPMKNAKYIMDELNKMFPGSKCELEFETPFELLVAVILSAQCTDKRVNAVTKELFKKFSTPQDFVNIPLEELEKLIHSCGFYHNKAINIKKMAEDVVNKFGGEVPKTREELCSLSGVGRKTANVMISEAFNGDAIAVDTHVHRIANRLGIIKSDDVFKVEKALMETFPQSEWSRLHFQMVLFGRYKCKALKPECEGCPFFEFCTEEKKNLKK